MGRGGRVVMKVRMYTTAAAMRKLGVDKDGDVQERVTKEVFANITDFMPKKSGNLIRGTSIKSPTMIHVNGPYARFLFFGMTRRGAQVNYSTEGNPNAGPNWDKRMMAARGDAIAAKVQRYVDRKKR